MSPFEHECMMMRMPRMKIWFVKVIDNISIDLSLSIIIINWDRFTTSFCLFVWYITDKLVFYIHMYIVWYDINPLTILCMCIYIYIYIKIWYYQPIKLYNINGYIIICKSINLIYKHCWIEINIYMFIGYIVLLLYIETKNWTIKKNI